MGEAVVSDDDSTHLSPSSILKSIKSNETGTRQAQVANASRSTNCFRNIGSFLYRYAMRHFPRGDRKTKDGKQTDAPISTWCSTSKESHSRGDSLLIVPASDDYSSVSSLLVAGK